MHYILYRKRVGRYSYETYILANLPDMQYVYYFIAILDQIMTDTWLEGKFIGQLNYVDIIKAVDFQIAAFLNCLSHYGPNITTYVYVFVC